MTGDEAIYSHEPVLLEEVLDNLSIRQGGVYLDGTIGWGGHSFQILKRYADTRIIGLDRDSETLKVTARRLAEFSDRVSLFNSDFRRLGEVLDRIDMELVDGILLDLGISSIQLEDPGRGFSFSKEGPLDMRMDPRSGVAAHEIVNTWSQKDLADLFFNYGEEKRSRAIAAAIVRERKKTPLKTTRQLADLICSVPGMRKVINIHPATRTFQALRIEVNDELNTLEQTIPLAVERLVEEGRLVIISFHSLEDRIVKRSFRDLQNPCQCPREFPECRCGKVGAGRVITKRPVTPKEGEIRNNPRSRSARLRAFEKRSERSAPGDKRQVFS